MLARLENSYAARCAVANLKPLFDRQAQLHPTLVQYVCERLVRSGMPRASLYHVPLDACGVPLVAQAQQLEEEATDFRVMLSYDDYTEAGLHAQFDCVWSSAMMPSCEQCHEPSVVCTQRCNTWAEVVAQYSALDAALRPWFQVASRWTWHCDALDGFDAGAFWVQHHYDQPCCRVISHAQRHQTLSSFE